jgi:catechol 2,3-dioxygenase-like lactoylglutathione lyase family enzyme
VRVFLVLVDLREEILMAVIRIVPNIASGEIEAAKRFYGDLLGMDVVMDMGWIVTFAADVEAAPQISVASEGGSGTPVPDLSIEVDNFEEVHRSVKLKASRSNTAQPRNHGASRGSMCATRMGA